MVNANRSGKVMRRNLSKVIFSIALSVPTLLFSACGPTFSTDRNALSRGCPWVDEDELGPIMCASFPTTLPLDRPGSAI